MRLEAIVLPLFILAAAACQDPKSPAVESGHLATVPRESLEQSIALAGSKIGELRHPVTASSEEARRFYEQGLAYLASFDWVRAARSFNESLRRDDALAPAHVGLARAFLGLESLADADRHMEEASRIAARGRLKTWEKTWAELGTLQVKAVDARRRGSKREHGAYLEAIERYIDLYPGDVHALVLRGNADSRPGAWGQAGAEGALPWYRQALERDSSHFPAHHFLGHAYENLGRHAEARLHASRYAALAPAVPHAHHMLAHVLPRLGEWEEALTRLEEADRLHRLSFEMAPDTEDPSRDDWHYGHNLRLLAAVYLRLGHETQAEATYRATFELPYSGRRAGFYCLPWLEYLVSRERYEQALTVAQACERRSSQMAGVIGASLRGEALLGLGRHDEAHEALESARQRQHELASSSTGASSEAMFTRTAVLTVRILEGKLMLHDEDLARGEATLLGVAEALGSGHSFDAWALGRLRIEEIAGYASRAGLSRLADTTRELCRRLDQVIASSAGASRREPPGRSHGPADQGSDVSSSHSTVPSLIDAASSCA